MAVPIQLDFEKFRAPGLYLQFDDGLFLTLTREVIDKMTQRYLRDPELLPASVKGAPDYPPCVICPQRDTALYCHALPTVFPFLEDMDRFLSFDMVTVVFRPEPCEPTGTDGTLHFARTTMQRALQYVSIMSLIYYCEVGRTYFKYFAGVLPFMSPMMIAERVYLNMYWDLHGDVPAVIALIVKMREELDITVRCQIARLGLLCQSDAFLNAFVNTHILTQLLEGDMETRVRTLFASRNMA